MLIVLMQITFRNSIVMIVNDCTMTKEITYEIIIQPQYQSEMYKIYHVGIHKR